MVTPPSAPILSLMPPFCAKDFIGAITIPFKTSEWDDGGVKDIWYQLRNRAKKRPTFGILKRRGTKESKDSPVVLEENDPLDPKEKERGHINLRMQFVRYKPIIDIVVAPDLAFVQAIGEVVNLLFLFVIIYFIFFLFLLY